MSDIWGSVTKLFNLNAKKVYIDNVGFRLHYKVTTAILVICGILVTSRQYFGDPIDCVTHTKVVEPILDQYCWVHGTFTSKNDAEALSKLKKMAQIKLYAKHGVIYLSDLPDDPNRREFHEFPGVVNPERPREYKNYYQWVWIVLFLQAASFYIGHFMWKQWEGGRIKEMVGGLNSHVLEDAVRSKHQATILEYFTPNSGTHRIYAAKYIICELYCLINVLLQIVIINSFIGTEFVQYGINIFGQRYGEDRGDAAMHLVFPYVTFCVIATNDFITTKGQEAMCVLPINVLNRRIYILLWFWLLFLTLISALGVLYRFILVVWERARKQRLESLCPLFDDETVAIVVQKCTYGDWFFLYELGRNMNPIYFAELLRDVASSYRDRPGILRSHTEASAPANDASKTTLLPY